MAKENGREGGKVLQELLRRASREEFPARPTLNKVGSVKRFRRKGGLAQDCLLPPPPRQLGSLQWGNPCPDPSDPRRKPGGYLVVDPPTQDAQERVGRAQHLHPLRHEMLLFGLGAGPRPHRGCHPGTGGACLLPSLSPSLAAGSGKGRSADSAHT